MENSYSNIMYIHVMCVCILFVKKKKTCICDDTNLKDEKSIILFFIIFSVGYETFLIVMKFALC